MKFEAGTEGSPTDGLTSWDCDQFTSDIKANQSLCGITMDTLDSLLLNSGVTTTNSFAELKPLPTYDYVSTTLLPPGSTDDISGEISSSGIRFNGLETTEFKIESPDYKTIIQQGDPTLSNGQLFFSDGTVSSSTGNSLQLTVPGSNGPIDSYLSTQEIDDIACLIGNAIADTTTGAPPNVPSTVSLSNTIGADCHELRDTWAELDAWIENACLVIPPGKDVMDPLGVPPLSPSIPGYGQQQVSTTTGLIPNGSGISFMEQQYVTSTQHMDPLDQTYLPDSNCVMQNRLQNGLVGSTVSNGIIKMQMDKNGMYSLPSYSCAIQQNKDSMPHSTHSSPIGVVSTTGSPEMCTNGRYDRKLNGRMMQMKGQMGCDSNGLGFTKVKNKSGRVPKAKSAIATSTSALIEAGKEKPIHRCTICNRGFLNKSNIKVHLRTHTGEKPFKCETCAKAFRQKAHLLKHVQIHRRISRD